MAVTHRVAGEHAGFLEAAAHEGSRAAVSVSRGLAAAHVRSLVRADSRAVKVLRDAAGDFPEEAGDSPAGVVLAGAVIIVAAGFTAAVTTVATTAATIPMATDSATTVELTAIPMATTTNGATGIRTPTAALLPTTAATKIAQ